MKKGTWVEVIWADPSTSGAGDPAQARITISEDRGRFHCWKTLDMGGHKIRVLVLSLTKDRADQGEEESYRGYHIFPKACVLEIHPIEEKRRAKR